MDREEVKESYKFWNNAAALIACYVSVVGEALQLAAQEGLVNYTMLQGQGTDWGYALGTGTLMNRLTKPEARREQVLYPFIFTFPNLLEEMNPNLDGIRDVPDFLAFTLGATMSYGIARLSQTGLAQKIYKGFNQTKLGEILNTPLRIGPSKNRRKILENAVSTA